MSPDITQQNAAHEKEGCAVDRTSQVRRSVPDTDNEESQTDVRREEQDRGDERAAPVPAHRAGQEDEDEENEERAGETLRESNQRGNGGDVEEVRKDLL